MISRSSICDFHIRSEDFLSCKTSFFCSCTEEVIKGRVLRYGTSAGSAEVQLIVDQQDKDDNGYSVNLPYRTSKRFSTRKRTKSQVEIIESNTNHSTTKIKYPNINIRSTQDHRRVDIMSLSFSMFNFLS